MEEWSTNSSVHCNVAIICLFMDLCTFEHVCVCTCVCTFVHISHDPTHKTLGMWLCVCDVYSCLCVYLWVPLIGKISLLK